MKLQYDPEKNEWGLPQDQLQMEISQAVRQVGIQKAQRSQNKEFSLIALFVVASVVGATCVALWTQGFLLLFVPFVYWNAYSMTVDYIKKN